MQMMKATLIMAYRIVCVNELVQDRFYLSHTSLDEKEYGRLYVLAFYHACYIRHSPRDLQHEAVKLIFEGLNICNEEVDEILDPSSGEKRVLDLGTIIYSVMAKYKD